MKKNFITEDESKVKIDNREYIDGIPIVNEYKKSYVIKNIFI